MSLKSDIGKYRKEHLPKLKSQESYFKKMTILEAIKKAAGATDLNGKIFSHQRKVGKKLLAIGENEILILEIEIRACKSFKEIFKITEQVRKSDKGKGLGNLWSYDTALRIAFRLGKKYYPKDVYVQAGVNVGANRIFKGKKPPGRYLSRNKFPTQIQALEPFEIENFLCVRKHLNKKNQC